MLLVLFSYWLFTSFYTYNMLTEPNSFNKSINSLKEQKIINPDKVYYQSCIIVSVFMGIYFCPKDLFLKLVRVFK